MTDAVISLDGIRVSASGRVILDVPHFAVAAGEVLALVGPNGAGKSTLLHVAALLRPPDAGAVSIHGERVTPANAARLRRSLSIVFQDPLLFAPSVLQNAAAGARFQGTPRAVAERQAREWLDRFGVGHLARRNGRGLSGGEARRVALARAFVTKPALILLDEPFSALDAPTRGTLLPELRSRLAEQVAAAILVTHHLDEGLVFAEQIALMDGGRVIAQGDFRSLLARPPSRRAAELLGIETILPAHVVQRQGRALKLMMEPRGPAILSCVSPDAPWATSDRVLLTLQASVIRVMHPQEAVPDAWNRLPGRVLSATPQHLGTLLVAATPAPLTAHVPWHAASHWTPGDPVTLAFPPDAAHIIREDAPRNRD